MATTSSRPGSETHEVFNQGAPMPAHDAYAANLPLRDAVRREGAGWAEAQLHELGRRAGDPQWKEQGRLANEHPPALRTHDRYGNRIDEVEFHPAYHALMEVAVANGLHSLPWEEGSPEGAHVARAALFMTWDVDAGHGCPISMSYAAVPALRRQPDVAAEWEPKLVSRSYDGALRHRDEKPGVIFGMAMTEKQGGSDVRANTTTATPCNGGGPGSEYELVGHKWFCSAPMSDAFLVLAQAPEGLTCFLLPRVLDGGERNAVRIQRLKDKLGNRSNASSEVEFHNARAVMVGEPGRGVPTIIEMVNHTRLDCVLGAAAGMRKGVVEAGWHAAHRSAFGRLLAEQPLMQAVLADLAVESEAATATALRLARAYDDPSQASFRRIATAVAKYWTCKRWPQHAAEALECLGGVGYVEETGMPRLFRESPLNSIWEGSGNVMCLDVLRALAKEPETFTAFFGELEEAAGADARLDAHVASLRAEFSDTATIEGRARRIVERMALALQGSLLVRHGDAAVADAFCATRLAGEHGYAFGALPAGIDTGAVLARALPQLA